MAIRPLNSVAGFSVGETPSSIILANGDITTTNITTTGVSNLNSISNVKITGGTSGQVVSTDGTGNLSFITVSSAGLTNGTSNIQVLNNGNITFSSGGNANIMIVTGTGVNVAGTLNTGTGNANVGNLGTAQVLATANITAPQLISNITTGTSPLLINSTTLVANLNADLLDGFNTATAATPSTVAVRDVNGNVSANFFIGNGSQLTGIITSVSNVSNGNSNLNIPAANGNINLSVAGNANILVVTGTGVNVTGTLNATGNANALNLGTAQVLATANVTAPQLISNVSTGTAPFVVTSTTRVANLNVAQANVSEFISVAAGTGNNFIVFANAATGNVAELTSTGLTANLSNNSITATTFVGALSGAATTAGTVTTNAQPNITSVGTLTSLAVTGNVTAGNVYANSGTIGASLLTGTLTTAAQPNITSVGTLTSVSVTGNVAAGNLTTTGVLSVTGTGVSSIAGNLDMTSNTIINLATPTNASDAATKQYVDDVAQGLHTHDSCNAATTTTLAIISGGTVTYNNGSSGVGANLTTTGSFTTIDDVTLSNGMRILVKNEANAAHNGIYDRTSSTVLTRSSDFDTPAEMAGGDFTFVTAGTLYDNTGWVMPDPVTTVGTSPVNWVQFSGAGTYTAGTGLTLTGSQFSITNTAVSAASYGNGDRVASFTVNAQGQLTAASNVVIAANAANLTGTTLNSSIVTSSLTSVGTLGTLNVTGNANVGNLGTAQVLATANVTAPQFISNVSTGTAPFVVNSTTQVANLNVATAGTVTTNAQPNITSVGTLTSLSVTGNVSSGNISGTNGNLTTANVSGNIILGNSAVTTAISWASATTTAITANQTIASFSVTGITGVQFLVKGIDSAGSKYGVATVQAVTDGTTVDYSTFGTVNLGGFIGSFAVNIVGGFVRLQVTPASSNSTVWTTQYRFI